MKNTREPLLHITKNDAMPPKKALLIRIIAIILALLVVGILSVILIKANPLKIYKVMFTSPFIDTWTLLQSTAMMLLFGLAVIPAFRMKFWNMGANGQVLMGCLAAIACMRYFTNQVKLGDGLVMIIMIAASILAAVVWAVVPAVFKALFNTNETLFTLMMNYIAIAIVNLMEFTWDKSGQGHLGVVNLLSEDGWFPNIGGNKYLLSIIVALIVAAILYVYIRYTKHGFEVDLVGESVNTAKYSGINVSRVIIRTLVLCGVICGLMGALYAGSISHTVNSSVGGKGFTAILVAWLAGFNPLIMILTSFFTEFVTSGAEHISTVFNLGSNDFANIVVGIIFFFVIGCEFFIRYRVSINPNYKKKAAAKAENVKAEDAKAEEVRK